MEMFHVELLEGNIDGVKVEVEVEDLFSLGDEED